MERVTLHLANGWHLTFEAVPWCVRHDSEAWNSVGDEWICGGTSDTERHDVRLDGTGNVWRLITPSLGDLAEQQR